MYVVFFGTMYVCVSIQDCFKLMYVSVVHLYMYMYMYLSPGKLAEEVEASG